MWPIGSGATFPNITLKLRPLESKQEPSYRRRGMLMTGTCTCFTAARSGIGRRAHGLLVGQILFQMPPKSHTSYILSIYHQKLGISVVMSCISVVFWQPFQILGAQVSVRRHSWLSHPLDRAEPGHGRDRQRRVSPRLVRSCPQVPNAKVQFQRSKRSCPECQGPKIVQESQ